MKKIKLIPMIVVLLSIFTISAQETSVELFSIPLSNPGNSGKLVVNQISGSISVVGYDGKEVVVKASFRERTRSKSKSKNGLKLIPSVALNLSAEEKDNIVKIINEQFNKKVNLEIKVPKNFSLRLSTVNNGDIAVNGIDGEMEISNVNGAITLRNVSGSASADTTNGNVVVVFNSITEGSTMAFSSFNGVVDVTFPKTLKANIKAKSNMGDIFTDFEMVVSEQKPEINTDISSKTYKVKLEQWIKGKINGGGPEMLFKNFNGDIIIRSRE